MQCNAMSLIRSGNFWYFVGGQKSHKCLSGASGLKRRWIKSDILWSGQKVEDTTCWVLWSPLKPFEGTGGIKRWGGQRRRSKSCNVRTERGKKILGTNERRHDCNWIQNTEVAVWICTETQFRVEFERNSYSVKKWHCIVHLNRWPWKWRLLREWGKLMKKKLDSWFVKRGFTLCIGNKKMLDSS